MSKQSLNDFIAASIGKPFEDKYKVYEQCKPKPKSTVPDFMGYLTDAVKFQEALNKQSDMPKMGLKPKPCTDHNVELFNEPRFSRFISGACNMCYCNTHCGGIKCKSVCSEHKKQLVYGRGKCDKCTKEFIMLRIDQRCFAKNPSRPDCPSSLKHTDGLEWKLVTLFNCYHPTCALDINKTTHTKDKLNPYIRETHSETPAPVYKAEIKVESNPNAPPLYDEEEELNEAYLYAYAECKLCCLKNIPTINRCTLGELINGEQQEVWSGWSLHDGLW
jgi:hypothetical protein